MTQSIGNGSGLPERRRVTHEVIAELREGVVEPDDDSRTVHAIGLEDVLVVRFDRAYVLARQEVIDVAAREGALGRLLADMEAGPRDQEVDEFALPLVGGNADPACHSRHERLTV